MQCLMDHIVLNVEDDRRMIAFYANVMMFPTKVKFSRIACWERAISVRKTESGRRLSTTFRKDCGRKALNGEGREET